MHIQTPDIGSDGSNGLSRYLCTFQVEGVLDASRYQITRKANRVGWSWTMALKDVRTRILEKNRDCLFTTQNWNGAVEFGRYIEHWIQVFERGNSLLSRREEFITVNMPDPNGGTIAHQEKVGIYTFDTGSRIVLFSSNPWALQTYEGDVRWDEAEFHERQEAMHTALATRIQFGFDYHAWSARNGTKNWFNQVLFKQASEPGSNWKVRVVDIYTAIEGGLLDKINERSGLNQTKEEFIADMKSRCATPQAFIGRFECGAVEEASAIVPWEALEKASSQTILRRHVMTPEIVERFGLASDCPTDAAVAARMDKMKAWLREIFGPLFTTPAQYRLGYDVAASGNGDLGSFWIAAKQGERLVQKALLTTQTEDWHFHEAAMNLFMESLTACKGCGDGTGIGQSITWKAAAKFAGRFEGVRFSLASKAEMGTRIMTLLSSASFEMAAGGKDHADNADVSMDFFSIEKKTVGNSIQFNATQNPLNKASHGDIFWSASLCAHADATIQGTTGQKFSVSSLAQRITSIPGRLLSRSPFGNSRPRRMP